MGKNKVRLTIGGLDYYITTDEEIAYMKNLGEDLDDAITGLIHDHPRLSQVQAAAILRALASILLRTTSMVTARMMTAPITMYWTSLEAPIRFRPLRMTAMIMAPIRVPQMVPLPPVKEAPPTMQAAMASLS